MNDTVNLKAYFERIGFSGSIAPTLATLEALHALHPASIPFENLSPLMGEPVNLDEASLESKLLHNRRGGYCVEHNVLFMRVLRELDYSVTAYAARVLWNHPEGAVRPLSHMVLGVEVGAAPYLADVGFGSMTLTTPLKLRAGLEQETAFATYRLVGEAPSYRLEANIGGHWRPVYSFELVACDEAAIEAINAVAYPTFADKLVAARTEKDVCHTLRDFRLSTYPRDGAAEPERRMLTNLPDVRDALCDIFGITLPQDERLDPAIEALLAKLQLEEAE